MRSVLVHGFLSAGLLLGLASAQGDPKKEPKKDAPLPAVPGASEQDAMKQKLSKEIAVHIKDGTLEDLRATLAMSYEMPVEPDAVVKELLKEKFVLDKDKISGLALLDSLAWNYGIVWKAEGKGIVLKKDGAEPPKTAAEWFGRRTAEKRQEALDKGIVNKNVNDAISRALHWLARHQAKDGSWSPTRYLELCNKYVGFAQSCKFGNAEPGSPNFDIGVTGLALLAFHGAGYTSTSSEAFAKSEIVIGGVIRKGLKFLIDSQNASTGCIGPETPQQYLYNHCMATMALAEAYGMTQSGLLREPAQKAVAYLLQAQSPGKAWRYTIKPKESDSSISSWALQALRSAEAAGLAGEFKRACEGWTKFYDSVTDKTGNTVYQHAGDGKVADLHNRKYLDHPTLSAIYAMGKAFLLRSKGDTKMKFAVELLKNESPEWDQSNIKADLYYWYHAGLAMYQWDGPGGADWKKWYNNLKFVLLDRQIKAEGDCIHGCWDPVDRWSCEGGRVYVTAMSALCLETPFRYPPISK